jgi:phage tail sheath protein FI
MAARALSRGAWLSPANEPLAGVIALSPAFARDVWPSLFAAQVNLVQQDPRGFLLLSADTLSQRSDLQPINVRRLLILLRRLALQEGMRYVFQSHDEAFRRLVHNQFERILADLYRRGAFAGDTAAAAYQVVTDDTVNTPRERDQGRFIVELRLAPSQPLAFITVRLVQTGHQGLRIQEV